MATEIGSIKSTLTADTSGFVSGMGLAKSGLLGFASAAAKGVAAAGAVAAAVTAASVKIAGNFESSIVSAGAKTNATTQQLQQMETAALSASGASEFSAKQAADALGFLAQAGFEVNEQISALPGVLNLASAGELQLAQAADIASNVLTGFGKSAKELAEVNDILVKTANSANTSVSQLGQAMSFAAPAAQGAGVSIAETAAIIGKLSDAGIQSGRAGRGFNAILGQMGKVAKELGGNLSGAQIEALGFSGSLSRLQEMGLSARNAIDLFGREAGPAIQALLSQGTASIDDLTDSLNNAAGVAGDVAAKKIDTLNGAMNVLTGNVQNVAIQYGKAFLPVLREVVPMISEVTAGLVQNKQLFRDVTDAVINFVPVIANIIRGLGDFTAGLHLAASASNALFDAVDVLSEGFRAIGLAATGNFKEARAALNEMTEDIVNLPARLDEAHTEAENIQIQAWEMAKGLEEAGERARANVDHFRRMADGATDTADEVARINENFGAFPALPEGMGVIGGSQTPRRSGGGGGETESDRQQQRKQQQQEMMDLIVEQTEKEARLLQARRQNAKAAQLNAQQQARENEILRTKRNRNMEAARAASENRNEEEKKQKLREDINRSLKEQQKQLQNTLSGIDSMTGSIVGLAGAIAKAGGAGEEAKAAISGVGSVLQGGLGIAGNITSGNIFGAISGGVGLLGNLIGSLGGGRNRGASQSRPTGMSAREFATTMAKEFAKEVNKQDMRPITLEFDGRGAITDKNTVSRLFDQVREEGVNRGLEVFRE
jgi:TP901 family phage tail tape measure protein